MSDKIIVIDSGGFLTEVKINGTTIHEGTGDATREALLRLAESFAEYLDYEFEYITTER